jgi:hypothetical protein
VKTGRKTIISLENQLESVLSSYGEENSRNTEVGFSRRCRSRTRRLQGSSDAAWNFTYVWSKYYCDASIERLSDPPFREEVASVLSHSPSHWLLLSDRSDSEMVDHSSSLVVPTAARKAAAYAVLTTIEQDHRHYSHSMQLSCKHQGPNTF